MSAVECLHAESDDPRNAGACRKCGKVMPTTAERDRAFEDETLELAAELCERVHSVSPRPFARTVLGRLVKGGDDYAGSWVSRPERELLQEASEEPADAVAWVLLYMQRLRGELPDEQHADALMIALDAMAYCAAADDALRRLGQLADELGRP